VDEDNESLADMTQGNEHIESKAEELQENDASDDGSVGVNDADENGNIAGVPEANNAMDWMDTTKLQEWLSLVTLQECPCQTTMRTPKTMERLQECPRQRSMQIKMTNSIASMAGENTLMVYVHESQGAINTDMLIWKTQL
jgi:hypothetical protein